VKSAEETGMLGQHWLDRFLRRNFTVAISKAESLSQAIGPVDKKYQNTAEELRFEVSCKPRVFMG